MIGRPHGPSTPPGTHHSFVNSTEAAMTAKLVRSLIAIASYYYQRHIVDQNIHNEQWKEQQEHGDMNFLPELVRLQLFYFWVAKLSVVCIVCWCLDERHAGRLR